MPQVFRITFHSPIEIDALWRHLIDLFGDNVKQLEELKSLRKFGDE